MLRIATLLFLLIPLSLMGTGDQCFNWSPLARQAYQKTIQLRFTEAQSLLDQLQEEEPSNLIRLHIENYLDFFRVFINEDAEEFERLEKNKDRRLQQLKDCPADSPWRLYLQADIRLQWALARLKFEEYATAFFEVNKAFKLLEENSRAYPGFMPNKKDLGILHAMVGTIPDGYKWAVEWLSSMEGSIAQGRGELEEVIDYARQNDFIFEEEAYVFYAYLLLHLDNRDEAAWKVIQESRLNPETNLLACFILANVAMRTGRNDKAIDLLQHRPGGRTFHPFPYLDFMLGIAKLQRLDADAGDYLQRYLDQFSGRNFIKEAHQKLAWSRLLQGDPAGYRTQMAFCQKEGYTIVESDKSALEEAQSEEMPNTDLLRARLLFDGGYFDRALQTIQHLSEQTLTGPRDILEYHYRLGRVYQALGKNDLALSNFQSTIDKGAAQPWYFACRAALETGRIYEHLGKKEEARTAYERCLSIKPEEHRAGLHQAAKAGLNRIK
ncbi:MAG: tetratricopeptide repeat protein [Lewinellaceae bacterium]|nr:tetratricopeptide repeat protein [Lewinellaceae bacterium]